MALRRMAYDALLEWKQSKKRNALLVDGTRQIGKTFLVDPFCRVEYELQVKVDFIEDADARRRYAKAGSAEQLIDLLPLELGQSLKPGPRLFSSTKCKRLPKC